MTALLFKFFKEIVFPSFSALISFPVFIGERVAVCSLSPFCYKIKTDGIVFHDFIAQQDDNNQCCQCAASPCDYPEVNFNHPHTGCSPGGRNMIL